MTLRKLIASIDSLNEATAKPVAKTVIAEGSMLKALNMITKSVAPAVELAKEFKMFTESSSDSIGNLESAWKQHRDLEKKYSKRGNRENAQHHRLQAHTINQQIMSHPDYKLEFTDDPYAAQKNDAYSMKNDTRFTEDAESQRVNDIKLLYSTFGNKGDNPHSDGVKRARGLYNKNMLRASKKEIALLLRMTDENGNINPTVGPTNQAVIEASNGQPNTDQILEYLTDAYLLLRDNKNMYSEEGFYTITRIYDGLRHDLKNGDYDGFSNTYEEYLSKYPDAAGELIDTMFEEAGLPHDGTIEQFLEKCSGMQEGTVLYGKLPNNKSFKVSYYDPKYDETRTSTIKSSSKDAALNFCAGKGYDVQSIDQQVEEGYSDEEHPISDMPSPTRKQVSDPRYQYKIAKAAYDTESAKPNPNYARLESIMSSLVEWKRRIAAQGMTQEGIGDTIKRGVKSVKRRLDGWDKDDIGPGGEELGNPKDIVRRNKGHSDDTVKRLHKASTSPIGFPFRQGDFDGADKHSPGGLQKRVLDREMKKRGLGEEQVTELSTKTLKQYHSKATRSEHDAENSNNGDLADKRLAGRKSATARLNGFNSAPSAYHKARPTPIPDDDRWAGMGMPSFGHSPAEEKKDREFFKQAFKAESKYGVFSRVSEGAPIKTFALKEDAMAMAKRYNKLNAAEGIRYVVRNVSEAMPTPVATSTTSAPTPTTPTPTTPTPTNAKPGSVQLDPKVAALQKQTMQQNIAKLASNNTVKPATPMAPADSDTIANAVTPLVQNPDAAKALDALIAKYKTQLGQP